MENRYTIELNYIDIFGDVRVKTLTKNGMGFTLDEAADLFDTIRHHVKGITFWKLEEV